MDQQFGEQIGNNLEVYMDYLFIKSVEEDHMLRDTVDTFQQLWKIIMKLNLRKCSFRMEEGKFLWVIVIKDGFKANPEKVQAISLIPPPISLKEVQKLKARLVAINRGRDVAQNPNDTEESIWCFLCEAQLYGAAEARKQFLEVGGDPRPVMRQAYNMFKDGGDPEKLVDAFSKGRESEYFYASLYAGLYYESQNEADKAKVHIVASCNSPYGQRSDDYMASLAKVHCMCRNWEL
ncbi:uncharacterized protein LOC143539566 [Bidens hawaiensis]|uniref:uncharacterized protein LOC143539566 n=1 Tax=Bidens hawaiensis TaxID=980011 RepID=UPI00404B0599